MPAREPADYGEMRFDEGRIPAKKRSATVLTRIWQKHPAGGAVSLCTLHGPQWTLQCIHDVAEHPHRISVRIPPCSLPQTNHPKWKDRSVLITAF
jgi:hypothetical protein